MKTLYRYIIFSIIFLSVYSCRDYVEIDPVGNNRTLQYTSDYRYLANNASTNFTGPLGMFLVSDPDVRITDGEESKFTSTWGKLYTWQQPIYEDDSQDSDWTNLYKAVYYSNVIIDGVMDSENGTDDEKKEIQAEAYVHRAYSYLQLVNMYGPQYDPNGDNSSSAVPLLLTPDLYSSLARSSVAEVYQQILSDLNAALENNIQETPSYNILPSKTAVYALLARTYLYMGDYENALENATLALQLQSDLIDLNTFTKIGNQPKAIANPEIILGKKISGNSYMFAPLDSDLVNSYSEQDLRSKYYIAAASSIYKSYSGKTYVVPYYDGNYSKMEIGPSVPEMYLIAAECYARLSNTTEALNALNTLRAARFQSNSEFKLTTADITSDTSLLDLVLEERRKELVGRGFHWFDVRRLNLDSNYQKTYTRTYSGQEYTLTPNSDSYTFPIYQDYIDLNPELGE